MPTAQDTKVTHSTCPSCHGFSSVSYTFCQSCRGLGVVTTSSAPLPLPESLYRFITA